MKTDLAPRYSHTIGKDTIILWFKNTNRYVVISESLHTLINLFLSTNHSLAFNKAIKETLQYDDDKCQIIYNEISTFLEDANTLTTKVLEIDSRLEIPKANFESFYMVNGKTITINFETIAIKGLIHPQIAHHSINKAASCDVLFDVFKTQDDLHLFKNKCHLGSYKTSEFHFLQGKFALELTNTIHNKLIDNWVATFHASTVTNGHEAIMIIGDSGNGKSTLSALLMANGFEVLADDFTPLYQDLNLYRYPAAISVKQGAFKILEKQITAFKSLKTYPNASKKVNIKYVPPISTFKTNRAYLKCSKVVYVKFENSKTSSLQEISTETILETLIPDSWISPDEHHALQFLNWLNDLKSYELNYSDNEFAIGKFKALFEQ